MSGPEPEGLSVGDVRYPSGPPDDWPAWTPMPSDRLRTGPPVPGPTPGPPRPPVRPQVVAALVVAGLLVVGAVVALVDRPASDPVASNPSTTNDLTDPGITAPPSEQPLVPDPTDPALPLPTDPDFPLPGGMDPEALARPLAEVLPELVDFVERTRGQQFRTEPVVEAVADDEFVRQLAEAQAEGADDLRRQAVAASALGIIEADTDLVEVASRAAGASVLGFYDPATAELYVKGDVVTPLVQSVIVHELTHALDDQVFDLSRIDRLAERDDESAFGLLALVEGTARWVETRFREEMTVDEQMAAGLEETRLGLDQASVLAGIPLAFLVQQQVPYGAGVAFVDFLVDHGGTAELDRAQRRPPTTSEQILVPVAFLAGQGSVPVPAPAAEGPVVDEGAFGAVDLRLLEVVADPGGLGFSFDGSFEPTEGFGGGAYTSWEQAGERCVRLVAVADNSAGGLEIDRIFSDWAAAVGDAEVDTGVTSAGAAQVTATRCA